MNTKRGLELLLQTCRCSWRCCSWCLGRWAGRRGRRGGSPARLCRCRGSPVHCRRYTGRSWSCPGGPRRAPWLLSAPPPHPAGPDCSEWNSRDTEWCQYWTALHMHRYWSEFVSFNEYIVNRSICRMEAASVHSQTHNPSSGYYILQQHRHFAAVHLNKQAAYNNVAILAVMQEYCICFYPMFVWTYHGLWWHKEDTCLYCILALVWFSVQFTMEIKCLYQFICIQYFICMCILHVFQITFTFPNKHQATNSGICRNESTGSFLII